MRKLTKDVLLTCDAKKVWGILTKKDNYEYWTQVFSPKSTYEGVMELGEILRFLDGEGYGLEAIVTVFRPYSQLVFTFTGEISKTGVKALDSEPKHTETYELIAKGDQTKLLVTADVDNTYYNMMDEMWDRGIERMKILAQKN